MPDPELAMRQPSPDASYSIEFNISAPLSKIAFALGATAGAGSELAAYFISDWPPVFRPVSHSAHRSHSAYSQEVQSFASDPSYPSPHAFAEGVAFSGSALLGAVALTGLSVVAHRFVHGGLHWYAQRGLKQFQKHLSQVGSES